MQMPNLRRCAAARPARLPALAAAGALALAASAGATLPPRAAAGHPAVTALNGHPSGVAVLSTSDAWAIEGTNVMFHWNGTTWTKVTMPKTEQISSISGDSPTDAWAVGITLVSFAHQSPLMLHWNGTTWTKVPGPDINVGGELDYVSADAPTDAWATGTVYNTAGASSPLFMHWNGTAWAKVTGPHPGFNQVLQSVTSISPTDAWTSEIYQRGGGGGEIGLQWNGTAWAKADIPTDCLGDMGTTASPTDIWSFTTALNASYACHWNGTAWTKVPIPDSNPRESVSAPDVVSSSLAFAVGGYDNGHSYPALLQWNGRKWAQVPLSIGKDSALAGVSASSPTNAWAVGGFQYGSERTGFKFVTLMMHWNGTTWARG